MELNKTILIIEDDAAQQELYKLTLKRAGFHSVGRSDPMAGLTWLEQVMPDLILLDIMLPQMSGVEMLARIRSTANGRHIPIIIVTASNISLDEVQDYGVDTILRKPLMPSSLVDCIKGTVG